jgi:hypothetical protein
MTETTLACPDCTTEYAPDDNYCRECGMYVAALRPLPVVRMQSTAVTFEPRQRAQLPAPVKRAVTAVAIGAALQVGVGLAGKYLAAQAGKKAVDIALQPRGRKRKRQPSPARPAEQPVRSSLPADVTAVSESVLVQRTWVRRS